MAGYTLRRSAAAALLLALVLSLTFFLLHLAPGDPTLLTEDPRLGPEDREALRRVYGLEFRARRSMGVHWGTFELAAEHLLEPPRALRAAVREAGLAPDAFTSFAVGETRTYLPQQPMAGVIR